MTAVQQYWLIENDVYVVSGLYPVVQTDYEHMLTGSVTIGEGTPDCWVDESISIGTMEGVEVEVRTTVWSYDHPYDNGGGVPFAGDKVTGSTTGDVTVAVVSTVAIVNQPYDPADKITGVATTPTVSAVRIVILYDHLYQTEDKITGSTSSTVTVTMTP